MNDRSRVPTGALYRTDPDRTLPSGAGRDHVPNSLGVEPGRARHVLHGHADADHLRIRLRSGGGRPGRRRVFAPVPDGAGYPDGATVDADGFLWSAHWTAGG